MMGIRDMNPNYIVGALTVIFVVTIGAYVWISKTKVDSKLCEVVQKNNAQEFENLRNYIHQTEQRAEQRHKELKGDLTEVKTLIKNNHKC